MMNILKRELKAGAKTFTFWTLVMLLLVFTGVTKFTGISAGGADVTALFAAFPRIVLAVFGMSGLDVTQFGGYYAVLAQYLLLLGAVYAVQLGHNALTRETVDKTYEFLFTKPRARSYILRWKLLAAFIYLTCFCILDFVFALSAVTLLELPKNMSPILTLFSLALWLVGIVFLSLGALFSSLTRAAEKGARLGNLAVLTSFVLGVVYDLVERPGLLRLLSAFRFFLSSELLEGRLNPLFTLTALLIAGLALSGAFRAFERRDLSAVA